MRLSLFKPLVCIMLKCLPQPWTTHSNNGHASYFAEAPCFLEHGPSTAKMDTPTPSQKCPASPPLNTEARQPVARVGSISPPRVLHSAPTHPPPQRKKMSPRHYSLGDKNTIVTQPSTYVPTISQSWLCRTNGSIICEHGIC